MVIHRRVAMPADPTNKRKKKFIGLIYLFAMKYNAGLMSHFRCQKDGMETKAITDDVSVSGWLSSE